ncbi:AAD14_1 [Sanghuangporus sanghuang]
MSSDRTDPSLSIKRAELPYVPPLARISTPLRKSNEDLKLAPPPSADCPAATASPARYGPVQLGHEIDQWDKFGMGATDKEASFKLLDAFFDAGGNFTDTANNHQDETSEMFIGEWAEKRGIRDQLVIAMKYTTDFKRADQDIKNKLTT